MIARDMPRDLLSEIKMLASFGLSEFQIACYFEMSPAAWDDLKIVDPRIERIFLQGRAQGVAKVAATLYDMALSGDIKAITYYLKAVAKWDDPEAPLDKSKNKGYNNLTINFNDLNDPNEAAKIYHKAMQGGLFNVDGECK